ncbi:MAG: hypothetical protein SO434_02215 [Eubacteriales bacterium]|nr:hypothetical protein [Eubacteriales bacterium]
MENERKTRRKSFFDNIKQCVKHHKTKRNFAEQYYEICEDESVRIRVNCKDGVFSQLGGKSDLDEGVLSYIEDKAYYVPIDRPLKICFDGVAKEDRQAVADAYKKYFDLKFHDKCLDLKICNIKSISLMIIGIAFLAAGIVVERFLPSMLISEILTVAASFSMWESVDFFLLERTNVNTEKLDTAQLLLAELEFED